MMCMLRRYFDGAVSAPDESGCGGGGAAAAVVRIGAAVDDPRFFTTLENTPIDFLVLGTDAKQGYEADTCVRRGGGRVVVVLSFVCF